MYKAILSLFITLLCTQFVMANEGLESLLKTLDQTIKDREVYSQDKIHTIEGLRMQYKTAGDLEQQFYILGKLFNEFDNYQTDEAYEIVRERLALADNLDSDAFRAMAHMNLADVYRTTGLYKEALETLDFIHKHNWQKEDLAYYYHIYHSLYVLMSDYAVLDADKKRYNKLVLAYKDSLLMVLDPNELSYPLVESTRYLMYGEFDQALACLESAQAKFGGESPMLNYTLSDIYYHKGDIEKQKYYLTLSAIGDLRSCIKEYISLHRLADLLYSEGDLDRAYFYMRNALDDAVFSNSRLRTLQVSKMLPIIAKAHEHKNIQERRTMVITLSIIAFLAVILLIALFFIYKQVKQLSRIKEAQKQLNRELKIMNDELSILNGQLEEANLIKVEYISHLFHVCSTYISKLENFRLLVKRNIQTNQVKQLTKMVSSSSLVNDELKEFYQNFDSIFLKIYPSFVDEFNGLLVEDGQITPKEGDLLTPELRIYALIKLGITDSVQIADFLHYSTQTIYNYRQKVRKKAKSSKGEFLDEIEKICS